MKKAVIWGLGYNYKNCDWIHSRYDVIALADSNDSVRERFCSCGIPVIEPTDMRSFDFDIIFLTPSNFPVLHSMLTELVNIGVRYEQVRFAADGTAPLFDELIEEAKTTDIVIYGLGYWAKTLHRLLAMYNVEPVCFADDESGSEDTISHELSAQVFPLKNAIEKYPRAIYLISDDGKCRNVNYDTTTYIRKIETLKQSGVYSMFSVFSPMKYRFLLDMPKPHDISKRIDNTALYNLDDLDEIIMQPIILRAGSVMLSQLFSDHPNLISLPAFFLPHSFVKSYIKRFRYLSGLRLALAVLSECKLNDEHANVEGVLYDKDGKEITFSSVFKIDKFCNYFVQYILNAGEAPDFGYIFKALHAAYANTMDRRPSTDKCIIYYHSHMWNLGDAWICKHFSKVSVVATVRDPVRASYSHWNYQWLMLEKSRGYVADDWFSSYCLSLPICPEPFFDSGCFCYIDMSENVDIIKTDYTLNSSPFAIIEYMLKRMSAFLEGANTVFIRFEDIKTNIEKTMRKACEMLQISFDSIILRQTLCGVDVYNRGDEQSSFISHLDPKQLFSATSANAIKPISYEQHFNTFDLFRIEMIFHRFYELFGYTNNENPDIKSFDEGTLMELFSIPFKSLKTVKINERIKASNTLYALMFFYLQSRVVQSIVDCSGGNYFAEV